MNKLIIALALLMGICSYMEAVEACVTYNPATNTYTVDPSGSIYHKKDNKKNSISQKSREEKK